MTVIAKRENLRVSRDSDGRVRPVEIYSIQLDAVVRVLPLTIGDMRGREEMLSVDVGDWSVEDRLELIRKHVVEPDMSDVTEEEAEDWDPSTLTTLAACVVTGSLPFVRNREERTVLEQVPLVGLAGMMAYKTGGGKEENGASPPKT